MLIWLIRMAAARVRGWPTSVLTLAIVFGVSWALMAAFEPPDSELGSPRNYWWWFVVTAFTVGYGDLFPVSTGGRIAAFLVMLTAIGIAAALINEMLERATARRTNRLKGLARMRTNNHFIIVGHVPERTERLVDELTAAGGEVVVCAVGGRLTEHPFPDRRGVHFARGPLTDESLFERAAFASARAVVVDSIDGDDEKAMLRALVINRRFPDLHVVVAVADHERAGRLLGLFGTTFECVDWHDYRLLADAAADPGVSRFHRDIRTSLTAVNTHSLILPDQVRGRTVGDLLVPLKERLNVSICAIAKGADFTTNPDVATPLEPGMTLYYLAEERYTWSDLAEAAGTGT